MVNLRQIGVKAMKKPEVKELLKETQEVIKGITVKKIKRKPAEKLLEEIPVKKKELVFKEKKPVKPEKSVIEAQDFLTDVKTKLKPSELKFLNINKIQDEKDVLKLLKTLADRYAKDVEFQRRGVQTHEATKKAAADLLQRDKTKLVSALLTLKPGDTLNAAWLTASHDLLQMLLVKGSSLKDAALKGGPNELLAFKQHLGLMAEIHKIYILYLMRL